MGRNSQGKGVRRRRTIFGLSDGMKKIRFLHQPKGGKE